MKSNLIHIQTVGIQLEFCNANFEHIFNLVLVVFVIEFDSRTKFLILGKSNFIKKLHNGKGQIELKRKTFPSVKPCKCCIGNPYFRYLFHNRRFCHNLFLSIANGIPCHIHRNQSIGVLHTSQIIHQLSSTTNSML